jgi:hypothetical protein
MTNKTIKQSSRSDDDDDDDDGDIFITSERLRTPDGDYSLRDIKAAQQRVSKPVLGPLLLGLLGTLNLAISFNTHFWIDLVAAAIMLGGGLLWRIMGTRYVLRLKLRDSEVDAWFTRRQPHLQQILEQLRSHGIAR